MCRGECQKGMNGYFKRCVSIENSNQTRHLKGIIIEGGLMEIKDWFAYLLQLQVVPNRKGRMRFYSND